MNRNGNCVILVLKQLALPNVMSVRYGMGATIKLTSKRQATFPVEVCEELGIGAGDEIELIPRAEDGKQYWILQKRTTPGRPWAGSLKKYAKGVEDHSMDSIRESIERGRNKSPS